MYKYKKTRAILLTLITYELLKISVHANDSKEDNANNLPCHRSDEGDILQPIENFTPDDNSIFFHETSCKGELNPRQACSIEAASAAHLNRTIYVLFNSPINNLNKLRNVNQFKNVHCARIHFNYSKGIVGESMNHIYSDSDFPIVHVADILRFVTLYRWGGTYLDLDAIVVRPLDELGRKWITAEYYDRLSIGAMDIPHDEAGQLAVKMILDEIKDTYEPYYFNYNGNGALSRAFMRYCNISYINILNTTECNGFSIFNSSFFYPVSWKTAQVYFKNDHSIHPAMFYQAYTHHMWNYLTNSIPIEDNSFYADLAKTYCPNTYLVYREHFGDRST